MASRGFNRQDARRNAFMLEGKFARRGYDWWWHSFTAANDATGEEVPFFIEYFLCNPSLGKEEPVLGQLKANRETGTKPSYLMVKAGCWGKNKKQLHRFFSWNQTAVHRKAPYSVVAGDCSAGETELRGSIAVTEEQAQSHPEWMSDSGSIKWNLRLNKQIAFNVGYGASSLFRFLKAFEMYWHAQGMKTLVEGTIELDGQKYTVKPETSFGYSDKNWGCGFTSPWVWISSWDLKSRISGRKLENSVLDIGGGRPKAFGISMKGKLLSAFWYEGKPYEFNFSKFWTGTKTQFSSQETDEEIIWHVKQQNRHALMETELHCKKAGMLFINYEDPDGMKKFDRLWNGGNGTGTVKLYRKNGKKLTLIDDIEINHAGCEYGEFSHP